MRIIHTADWHLCDRLGRIDRTKDLEQRVERVAALCEERAADLLLIAGDLFYEDARLEHMAEAFTHIRKTFAPFFARGGTILSITGNHDRDAKINLVRGGMSLAVPHAGAALERGRMHLINGRTVCSLADAAGQRVQFVLVPYPFPSRYNLVATGYRSKEEENRLLHEEVAKWIQGATAKESFDTSLPTVLVAHLHVRGAEVHSLYKMTERDDVLFDFAELNPSWAYVALGHIHKPQSLGGAAHVRYPGSLDRLDFGETHDDHGVLFLEITSTGLVGEPERLPIPATPFHTIALTDPEAELPGLAEKYRERETALARITVAPPSAGLSREEVARQVRHLFPRLHQFEWAEQPDASGESASTFVPRHGFETTVRDYLAERLADDPDKDAILAMVEPFLAKAGDS